MEFKNSGISFAFALPHALLCLMSHSLFHNNNGIIYYNNQSNAHNMAACARVSHFYIGILSTQSQHFNSKDRS